MSSKGTDGGPAFPSTEQGMTSFSMQPVEIHNSGMTLRDYFAAAALPACIQECLSVECRDGETLHAMLARRSYEMADAMLKARGEGQ